LGGPSLVEWGRQKKKTETGQPGESPYVKPNMERKWVAVKGLKRILHEREIWELKREMVKQ